MRVDLVSVLSGSCILLGGLEGWRLAIDANKKHGTT